jgi:hypothetical protein
MGIAELKTIDEFKVGDKVLSQMKVSIYEILSFEEEYTDKSKKKTKIVSAKCRDIKTGDPVDITVINSNKFYLYV